MKDEIKNEMDGLLRRVSRRNDATPQGGDTSLPSEHLDSDELNTYAERALPEKTRLRYTEHLAECSKCRTLVTQLSQSSGVERLQNEKAQPSWLAGFFSRFLSPFSWRLAFPVLAAVGIIAIGLIVFRRESPRTFIAERTNETMTEKAQATPVLSDGDNNSSPQSKTPTVSPPVQPQVAGQTGQHNTSSNANVSDRVESAASSAPKDQPAGSAPASASADAAPAPVPAEELTRINVAENQQKLEDLKKEKQAEEERDKATNAKEPPAAAKTRNVDELRGATSTAEKSTSGGALQMSPGFSAGKRERKDDESKNDSETKSLAGRQFRKRGNTWMDTAYNSSMTTMTVARGSESYRALVADEPAIRTIADQLDGTVVVVWKGKAYLIR